MEKKSTKALEMLLKGKTATERAESFHVATKRAIQRDVIDELTLKKEGIEDKIQELQDFQLETNINSGQIALSKKEVERRFKEMLDLECELELVKLELEMKTRVFKKYFENETC